MYRAAWNLTATGTATLAEAIPNEDVFCDILHWKLYVPGTAGATTLNENVYVWYQRTVCSLRLMPKAPAKSGLFGWRRCRAIRKIVRSNLTRGYEMRAESVAKTIQMLKEILGGKT